MDPTIFPEPFEFYPERWIEAKENGVRLDQYMVSFTKGSRQCVGIKYVSVLLSRFHHDSATYLISEQ